MFHDSKDKTPAHRSIIMLPYTSLMQENEKWEAFLFK